MRGQLQRDAASLLSSMHKYITLFALPLFSYKILRIIPIAAARESPHTRRILFWLFCSVLFSFSASSESLLLLRAYAYVSRSPAKDATRSPRYQLSLLQALLEDSMFPNGGSFTALAGMVRSQKIVWAHWAEYGDDAGKVWSAAVFRNSSSSCVKRRGLLLGALCLRDEERERDRANKRWTAEKESSRGGLVRLCSHALRTNWATG